MATLNAGSEKPLGLFSFGCFRLQNAVNYKVRPGGRVFDIAAEFWTISDINLDIAVGFLSSLYVKIF